MKSILIPAFTMAATILTLSTASPQPAQAADSWFGWCGWLEINGYIQHDFVMAHNITCMTNPHTKKIPGLCTSGGATHTEVISLFCL